MNKRLFISKNKVLGQGLLAAIKARPELGLEWLPQFSYSEAAIGADVYHADVAVSYTHLDVYKRQVSGRPHPSWMGPVM